MAEDNRALWRGIRNALGDAGIEIVQNTATDLLATVTMTSLDRAVLDNIAARVLAIIDDSTKGLLRSIGDAGASPSNTTGFTLLQRLSNLATLVTQTDGLEDDTVKGLLRSIGDAGASPNNAAGDTVLKLMDAIRDALRSSDGDTGTQIIKSIIDQSGTTGTMYTVTTAKTLYLCSAWIGILTQSVNERQNKLFVTNAADAAQYDLMEQLCSGTNSLSITQQYRPPIKIPAGFKIKLVTSASTYGSGGFHGWEE